MLLVIVIIGIYLVPLCVEAGIILGMGSANERRYSYVMPEEALLCDALSHLQNPYPEWYLVRAVYLQ